MAAGRLCRSRRPGARFPLMIHEGEGLAELVFLDQLVDDGQWVNDLVHTASTTGSMVA